MGKRTPDFQEIEDFISGLSFKKVPVGANEEDVYACIQDLDAMYKDKLVDIKSYYDRGVAQMNQRLAASQAATSQLKSKLMAAKQLYDGNVKKIAELQQQVSAAQKEPASVQPAAVAQAAAAAMQQPAAIKEQPVVRTVAPAVQPQAVAMQSAVAPAVKPVVQAAPRPAAPLPIPVVAAQPGRALDEDEMIVLAKRELRDALQLERNRVREQTYEDMHAYADQVVEETSAKASDEAQRIYREICDEIDAMRNERVAQMQAEEERYRKELAEIESAKAAAASELIALQGDLKNLTQNLHTVQDTVSRFSVEPAANVEPSPAANQLRSLRHKIYTARK